MQSTRWGWLWVVLWAALSAAWCLTSTQQLGPTFDEPFYLEEGLRFWRTGSTGGLLVKGTMPLPIVVTTAPVRAWELWRGEPIDLASEMPMALALARPAALVFWALLLVFAWKLARRSGGPLAGWLVVPLVACEPILLANAGLATTDVALAACFLVFVHYYLKGRERSWWHRVGLPGALYGVALLAKASALAFGVIVLVTIEALRAWEQAPPTASWRQRLRAIWSAWWARPFRKDSLQLIGIALAVTFLGCGSDWRPERSFSLWAHSLPEGPLATTMTGLADHLRIFPNAGHAIARQIKHNMQGHGAYLLGQTSPSALWYYFPVALTIKLALPLLLLFGAVLLLSPRSLANRLLAVAAALLLFSFNCRVQIGTRLVLPLVVFLVIGLTAALADAWQRLEASWRRRGLALAGAVALFWLPIAPARAWPQGLQYVNELWGGPREGYRHVGGSDYDWGQGVPELRRWAAGRPLVVLYYGTDPAVRAPDWRHLDPAAPVKDLSAQGVRQALQGRPLAVSIALLYGPPTPFARLNDLLALLRQRQPVDRTSCFFFYDFAGPE